MKYDKKNMYFSKKFCWQLWKVYRLLLCMYRLKEKYKSSLQNDLNLKKIYDTI